MNLRRIPTEEVLKEMRHSDPPVYYLVGTPRGRLSRYEKALTAEMWEFYFPNQASPRVATNADVLSKM